MKSRKTAHEKEIATVSSLAESFVTEDLIGLEALFSSYN
jgi:hypothetical protein